MIFIFEPIIKLVFPFSSVYTWNVRLNFVVVVKEFRFVYTFFLSITTKKSTQKKTKLKHYIDIRVISVVNHKKINITFFFVNQPQSTAQNKTSVEWPRSKLHFLYGFRFIIKYTILLFFLLLLFLFVDFQTCLFHSNLVV